MASLDLRAGLADVTVDASLAGDALFHAQQAAEKSLKGFLFWHDIPFRKTHDLRELLDACVQIDASIADHAAAVEEMTPFAWTFRYPVGQDLPEPAEAREALRIARALHDAILARLPAEVRPA